MPFLPLGKDVDPAPRRVVLRVLLGASRLVPVLGAWVRPPGHLAGLAIVVVAWEAILVPSAGTGQRFCFMERTSISAKLAKFLCVEGSVTTSHVCLDSIWDSTPLPKRGVDDPAAGGFRAYLLRVVHGRRAYSSFHLERDYPRRIFRDALRRSYTAQPSSTALVI